MGLIEIRNQYHLSQSNAAALAGIPLRTYVRYEKDEQYGNEWKREIIRQKISDKCQITENKGLLTIDEIKEKVSQVLSEKYAKDVAFCFLFGSYAKGYATEKSDVDLVISTELKGLDFVGISEDLRAVLHKKIDLIRLNNIANNVDLLNEILHDGVKIYEQPKN